VLNEHWSSVKVNEIIKWIIEWWLSIIEDTWCYQVITEGENQNFRSPLQISIWFSWAFDLHIINFRFCLAAVSDEQRKKLIWWCWLCFNIIIISQSQLCATCWHKKWIKANIYIFLSEWESMPLSEPNQCHDQHSISFEAISVCDQWACTCTMQQYTQQDF